MRATGEGEGETGESTCLWRPYSPLVSYVGTLRALLSPRRAVPLAAVALALVGSEWAASGSWIACALDALLFVAFCLVAPASWRAASAWARAHPPGWAAYGAFVLVGALLVRAGASLPSAFGLPGTYVLDAGALGLLLVLFLVGGWGLGRDIDLELGIASAERKADVASLDAERARVVAMRAQLDPHFLFNTLNAIAEWCREDPARAERATLQLAAMLRAILEGSRRPSWPLADELALLEQLTSLYAARDPERYRFVLDLPQPLPDVEVPPMLWLPLLENAITHGPAAGHAGQVTLSVRAGADGVSLSITNPGVYTGRREGGQGIAMVERRLALAYGEAAQLTLRAMPRSTHTELRMPRAPITLEVLA